MLVPDSVAQPVSVFASSRRRFSRFTMPSNRSKRFISFCTKSANSCSPISPLPSTSIDWNNPLSSKSPSPVPASAWRNSCSSMEPEPSLSHAWKRSYTICRSSGVHSRFLRALTASRSVMIWIISLMSPLVACGKYIASIWSKLSQSAAETDEAVRLVSGRRPACFGCRRRLSNTPWSRNTSRFRTARLPATRISLAKAFFISSDLIPLYSAAPPSSSFLASSKAFGDGWRV
mmetsp:Transcript_75591/g.226936  ORF Transcript_75591/g.226936 Transcript_75591/m.226936 type:complete len:232 (-) Transcript_75591:194-889(-)